MTYEVKDLMDRYNVTQTTVLHWLTTGQLRGINVGRDPGKLKPRWRVTEEALRDFELSRAMTPPPAPAPRKRRQRNAAADEVVFYK